MSHDTSTSSGTLREPAAGRHVSQSVNCPAGWAEPSWPPSHLTSRTHPSAAVRHHHRYHVTGPAACSSAAGGEHWPGGVAADPPPPPLETRHPSASWTTQTNLLKRSDELKCKKFCLENQKISRRNSLHPPNKLPLLRPRRDLGHKFSSYIYPTSVNKWPHHQKSPAGPPRWRVPRWTPSSVKTPTVLIR